MDAMHGRGGKKNKVAVRKSKFKKRNNLDSDDTTPSEFDPDESIESSDGDSDWKLCFKAQIKESFKSIFQIFNQKFITKTLTNLV